MENRSELLNVLVKDGEDRKSKLLVELEGLKTAKKFNKNNFEQTNDILDSMILVHNKMLSLTVRYVENAKRNIKTYEEITAPEDAH